MNAIDQSTENFQKRVAELELLDDQKLLMLGVAILLAHADGCPAEIRLPIAQALKNGALVSESGVILA